MKKFCIAALVLAVTGMVSARTLTVKFGSAMEVEIDGAVRKFAKGETFDPTAIPCLYRMRPANMSENERTFCIEGTEFIRGKDVYRRFPQYGEGNWVRVALDPYPVDDTTVTLTARKTSNFFYVDAEHGNDDWDGTADYDHRDEQSLKGPKKTLQAAHDAATGDYPIVFAAPGVYDSGVATNYSSSGAGRCIRRLIATKSNIGFIATKGAKETFIVGSPDLSSGGNGDDAVAGVYMQADYQQFLQGFTITGCYSPAEQSKSIQYGIGFCSGARRAYCLDCVISNNYAVTQGPATYYGVIERSWIMENESLQFTTRDGVFVSCVFAGNKLTMSDSTSNNRALQQSAQSYFCTYDMRRGNPLSGGRKRIEDGDSILRTALVCGLTEKSTTTTNAARWCDSKAIDNPLFVDAAVRDYRLQIQSPAIDVSSYKDDLNGEARMVITSDIYGNARVMNGAIDLGAVEYDWRPVFAQEIGKKIEIEDMSSSVTTNAAGGLFVPSGAIAGKAIVKGLYEFAFTVAGGTLEAFRSGESLGVRSTPGEHVFRMDMLEAGEKFRFVFTPAEEGGYAVFNRALLCRGVAITVK